MNRLYCAEPTLTITGSNADHRIAIAARGILPIAQVIASSLGAGAVPAGKIDNQDWTAAVVRDLNENRGASVVIAGEMQPPEVHALVGQINGALGNNGVTIRPAPPLPLPGNRIGFRELVAEMQQGDVELLVVLGGNPIYDAPVDLNFGDAFEKVKLRVHHSIHFNETSRQSHWHIPATHFLETWSDIRAFDGTFSIVQPLIEPMYAGISAHELLEALGGQSPRPNYEIVRSRWAGPTPAPDFELKWRQALSEGVVRNIDLQSVRPAPNAFGAETQQSGEYLHWAHRPEA